jgi:hypothetical protein
LSDRTRTMLLIAVENHYRVWVWQKMRKGTNFIFAKSDGLSGILHIDERFCYHSTLEFGASVEVAKPLKC